MFAIAWNVAMQENVREDTLARAYSYDSLGSFVAMTISQITFGPLGAALGHAEVLAIAGARPTSRRAWTPCCRGPFASFPAPVDSRRRRRERVGMTGPLATSSFPDAGCD